MMPLSLKSGTLHITDDVAAMITEAVINETNGIAGTMSGFRDAFASVVNKNVTRGIAIDSGTGAFIIDTKISVVYGYNIGQVCYEFQQKVQNDVAMMTGFRVDKVNVYVEQIVFDSEALHTESF